MNQTKRTFKQGQRLTCNGQPGSTIVKIHTGQLAGMADVRTPGGVVCVGLSDLALENPPVHHFPSSAAAYEACQGKIPTGEILVILAEGAVAIADTPPVAVGWANGSGLFHTLGNPDEARAYSAKYPYAFREAERLAPMVEAIANANAHLKNMGLPTAVELVAALAAMLNAYGLLHDRLSDCIESGRLKESDLPDDYKALANQLAGPCNAADALALLALVAVEGC